MVVQNNCFKRQRVVQQTLPQLMISIAPQRDIFAEMARGAGKTTVFGKRMRDLVIEMPRASFAMVGQTYMQMLARTLPSAIEGLEMFGLYKDIDYVVGRCGQKNGFAMPFQPPSQWNNIIHFANGAIFQLVSLDNPNSGRGLNSFAELGDEAALLDPEKLYNNVKTTNRAQKAEFKKCKLLGSQMYVSSTPVSRRGQWFVDMEKKAKQNPHEILFIKASALSNPYLRADWFKKMKDEAVSQTMYDAEILNIRPKKIENGFYANLSKRHYYSDYNNSYLEGVDHNKSYNVSCLQDSDIDFKSPLIVSLDFGVFNCCVVAQEHGHEFRVLKSMYVKSPKLLDDLFLEQFIPYYRAHQEKVIYLYGGHDGHHRLPNSSMTLFEQVIDLLTKNGWTVHLLAKPVAATHADKFLLINAMLKESDNNLPSIRINEHNNPDLIIALERAEAKEGPKGVEKNKSSERNSSLPQEHATHYTDALDHPLYALYNDRFTSKNSSYSTLGGIFISN
ncbi:hypothetical protein HX059_03940 [Myroides marinus]|uniref:hypothetical protein n=2 Tax=Flavobacteriaceae TaxID=49546 RepID=UPI002575178E|nr:hypothetical protein [Myroides odoratimimus]MDM1378164.1 hypothetical protein [Myroides marinus]MDM1385450.1 hypothetical protein [Myroides marinus]MDM1392663.1 hypothetical protein [Myroides marinus]MDM1441918.1 hypothetical protein [Myroides odoratimimus]